MSMFVPFKLAYCFSFWGGLCPQTLTGSLPVDPAGRLPFFFAPQPPTASNTTEHLIFSDMILYRGGFRIYKMWVRISCEARRGDGDAKGVEERGMGKGVPIPNRLEGVGSIVNLPQRDPGCTGSLAESGYWCILSLKERMWYVTKISIFDIL